MWICDLQQEQYERLVKIDSNELYQHEQCYKNARSHKNVKKMVQLKII